MSTRRSLLFCLTLLALCGRVGLSCPDAYAASTAAASAFVDKMGNEAVAAMADKSLSKPQRVERFRVLLHQGFDMATVARFVLGRYWNAATPQQQQEYLVQFEEMVVRSYAERFDSYAGETFRIVSSRPDGDTDAFVATEIRRVNGPPVNVEWRVRERDGRFGIIDVVVEGVSMSVTQRQEFSSVIQAKGGNMDEFLKALKDKNAAMATAIQ
ncbi:MAG: ABC transporter substrate-binding protein [Rhodospirillaceae bacterium]